jgi:phospholipid transport system substrate-binding protein
MLENTKNKECVVRFFYILVLLLMIPGGIYAADNPTDVEALLRGKLDSVTAVLQKSDLDLDRKKLEISEIVSPMFDFGLMAKLTMGRKHWTALNKAQKERFAELFTKLLKETYLEKISLYSDETVDFLGSIQIKNKVHVTTELNSKGKKISMLYKFYNSREGWKIYDVEIEGISLITSYRSQFDQELRNGTVDDLLLKMEKPKNSQPG